MTKLTELYQAILDGDSRRAKEVTDGIVATQGGLAEAFKVGVMPAMREAQRRYHAHEFHVPEMLIACRAMQAAMQRIRPSLACPTSRPIARLCVVSLSYQEQDPTATITADLLEAAGFEVACSSLAVPEADRAPHWQTAHSAMVVLVVPLTSLARGVPSMDMPIRRAVESLRCERVKYGGKIVLVGGDSTYVDQLHLDAYVDDVADVVPAVERLITPNQ
jgi:methanogenic corrinoid protein MtbC1